MNLFLNFQQPLFQSSVSYDPSEIILIGWFGAQEIFLIIMLKTVMLLNIFCRNRNACFSGFVFHLWSWGLFSLVGCHVCRRSWSLCACSVPVCTGRVISPQGVCWESMRVRRVPQGVWLHWEHRHFWVQWVLRHPCSDGRCLVQTW